ncbi:ABC transporter permease [Enterococcus sp. LJL98]
MKRYLSFRILRSIISIFLVTTITYGVIYTMVPRRNVFKDDVNYGKLKGKPDELANYENTAFSKMGYIDFLSSKELIDTVRKEHEGLTGEPTAENKAILEEWAKTNGWELRQLPISQAFYTIKDIPLPQRVFRFYANMIQIDHPWKVKDPSNPDLKRSLRFEKDDTVGFALVGSGTQYKYQIYFDKKFPYIHQNIVHLNLGTSYPTFAGQDVMGVISNGQGKTDSRELTFPTGVTVKSAADLTTRQYQLTEKLSSKQKKLFNDNYANTENIYRDPSMIGTSFRMGIIAVFLAYGIGIPFAMLMARYKGRFPDKIGIGFVTVLISVPSLAFIYFFRYIGSNWFGLPDSFPTLGAGDIRSYVLPTVILGLLSVSNIVIWIRRYMIDQQSADYVKFAKAKGLSTGEIARKHIFKNAAIPIANQIPMSIIGAITGATITETVFAAPGMGKMLPDAIIANNNPIVIAIVFVFTTVAVTSVLLGDLTMALVDPRINLAERGE